jgi:hypothetical protein
MVGRQLKGLKTPGIKENPFGFSRRDLNPKETEFHFRFT